MCDNASEVEYALHKHFKAFSADNEYYNESLPTSDVWHMARALAVR